MILCIDETMACERAMLDRGVAEDVDDRGERLREHKEDEGIAKRDGAWDALLRGQSAEARIPPGSPGRPHGVADESCRQRFRQTREQNMVRPPVFRPPSLSQRRSLGPSSFLAL